FLASSFLQIPSRDGHPCLRLYPSHYRADSGLAPVRNVRRQAHTTKQQMEEYSSNVFSKAVQQTNNTLAELEKVSNLFTSYSSGNYSLIHNLKPYADPNANHDELSIYQTKQNLKYLCQNLYNTYDFIYGIYIFTPSDVDFTFENTPNNKLIYGYSPDESDWYEKTISQKGQLCISDIKVHQDIFQGSRESFFISKSLYDVYSSENLGVLLINCKPSLFDMSQLNTIPNVTSITVADTTRQKVIYSTAPNDTQLSYEEAKSQASYSSHLLFSSLTLFTSVDDSRLYLQFNTTGILLLLIALICIIGGILLAMYFSKTVTTPIVQLSQKMSTQKEGNLSVTNLYLDRSDEIGVLYNEYNAMIEQLHTAIKTNYQNKLISLDAQMKSLEARINSHFLFNTLEAINSIASIEGSSQIQDMAMSLGNMFRYAIKTQSELVSLQDEINHVMDYVSIQSIRFNHRFTFSMHIPDKMLNLKMLKLILQPIVENSFSHGLQNCQLGHSIHLYGFLRETCFYLYVIDDGKGMEADQLLALNESLMEEPTFTELGHRTNQSIGLKNINTRIELYYGKGYGLFAESKPKRGTLIRIKLPYLVEKEDTDV
ncbi:MAG: histidine kinase, partial [Hespellia sp.]|nr:histidine kinase [Hespellia sp.]